MSDGSWPALPMDDILLDDSLLQYLGTVERPADPRRPAGTAPLAVPGDPLDIDLQGAYFDMKNDIPLPEGRRWSQAHTRQPSLAGSFRGDPESRPYCAAQGAPSKYSAQSVLLQTQTYALRVKGHTDHTGLYN